ncbi:hypothetical protein [Rhodococcus daqingensis]|uniref:Uncharacterized protein n=1 Tax=Rhodococcus daqingensis TaxID=2479363 RepID=A0ABW2RXY5_9NOCA
MDLGWFGDAWGWFNTARVASLGAVVAATVAVLALQRSMRDSRSRARPMVAAELVPDRYADGVAHLVVRNFGPSLAKNVRVAFDPPLHQVDAEDASLRYIERRYSSLVATLVPGAELRNVYWDADRTMPPPVTVTLECESADGRWYRRPDRYRDEFVLDAEVIRHGTYVTSPADPKESLKAIAKAMKSIARTN